MGGYLSGATIIAIQAGLIAGIFASIVGLPYPWAIALGAAVLDFIPVVGPIIVGVSMTLIGFTQGVAIGIIAGVFYLAQHMFETYWLYPRVMRRTVDISTGAVVVAIIVGGALLGVTGAILAVPVAAGGHAHHARGDHADAGEFVIGARGPPRTAPARREQASIARLARARRARPARPAGGRHRARTPASGS